MFLSLFPVCAISALFSFSLSRLPASYKLRVRLRLAFLHRTGANCMQANWVVVEQAIRYTYTIRMMFKQLLVCSMSPQLYSFFVCDPSQPANFSVISLYPRVDRCALR
ncbi:hypothetical protein DFH11DRAFT_1617440, partial [Phellopilus nigrolimitatus]